ncbi:retrovirus-related pol polyprotein from transposon TNT 1-94, partial [Tanacetum coccineum]
GDKHICSGTTRNNTLEQVDSNTGKQRTVICYNCKGEGHISKQCTIPKRKRDETWFNDKVLLVQAQASGQVTTHNAVIQPISGMPMTLILMNLTSAKIALMMNSFQEWLRCLTEVTSDNLDYDLIIKFLSETQQETVQNSNSSAQQDVLNIIYVIKERTTATAITEGTWGFKHTKACFRDEIIPFRKELKDIFNNFNQYLVDELADVQNVFYQMEQAVEQHRLESRTFKVKMNQVLSENERLLAQAIDHDIVKTVVNLSVNDGCETVNEFQKCLELKTELLNKKDVVDRETYDKLVRLSTSASGSQPSGNTRNDKIQQTPSSNSKNKVEAHPRNVKSSLNKRNGTVKVNGSASVQNSKKHDNSDYVCINDDDCMSSDNLCVSNSMNDVKFRAKPKNKNPKEKIETNMEKITTTNEVPSRKPIVLESESPKPVVNLVYSRKPRKNKNTESVSKTEVIKTISANKQEPSKSWGSTKTNVPSTSLNECRLSKSSFGIWTPVARSTL